MARGELSSDEYDESESSSSEESDVDEEEIDEIALEDDLVDPELKALEEQDQNVFFVFHNSNCIGGNGRGNQPFGLCKSRLVQDQSIARCLKGSWIGCGLVQCLQFLCRRR